MPLENRVNLRGARKHRLPLTFTPAQISRFPTRGAALTDREQRLPPDLVGCLKGKAPVQVFDHAVDNLPVPLFGTQPAPKASRTFGVTLGFKAGDRPAVFVDPVVTKKSALGEQPQKVGGLAAIGCLSLRAAMESAGSPIRRNVRPVRGDGVWGTKLVGHVVPLGWGSSVLRGQP